MTTKPQIYFAAPFFSVAERAHNATVVSYLGQAYSVFYPWRDGLRMFDLVADGMNDMEAARVIWDCDIEILKQCDAVVAVLDGRVPDEGVCVEIGAASILKKPVVGYFTDARNAFPWGMNPMIRSALNTCVKSVDGIIQALEGLLERTTIENPCLAEAQVRQHRQGAHVIVSDSNAPDRESIVPRWQFEND